MTEKKLRILLLAYACEPNKSSEQEVGWKWALHLSEHCQVTVITRTNNRNAIENQALYDPRVSCIQWIYHDLGECWLLAKQRLKAHRLYYTAWQRSVERLLKSKIFCDEYDIIHHLTFASYRYKTAIASLRGKKIWGPVGGAEATPWHLLPWNHLPGLAHEVIRNLMGARAPGLKEAELYDKIFCSTKETERLLRKRGYSSTLMPTIGLDQSAIPWEKRRIVDTSPLRLLYIGNLQHLKGIHLAIESLNFTKKPSLLSIVGKGNFESTLKRIATKQGVSERVQFLGYVPNAQLKPLHESHDVFIFPSLHDSGGIALMEAMAAEMPSIVLRCGGPEILTSEFCAQRISLGSKMQIINGLAKAIDIYAADSDLRFRHGTAAKQRVMDFYLWENKAKSMVEYYEELVTSNKTPRKVS